MIYKEKLSSNRTEALFVALTVVFLGLFIWRVAAAGPRGWAIAFLCAFTFFLFYALNYRTLVICLTSESLTLTFGVFKWAIPIDTVETCHLDSTSIWRIGGAGIHFSSFERRYRAMFNFLEYPRVVIALKEKRGPVRDIAFSTRHPEEIMSLIREMLTKGDVL